MSPPIDHYGQFKDTTIDHIGQYLFAWSSLGMIFMSCYAKDKKRGVMNYLLGVIYLILSSNQGLEPFVQALLVVLLLQLAWHMKRPLFMNVFRILAFIISLFHLNPSFYYVFLLYALADLLLSSGEFYLPFAGIVLLGIYVYGVKSLEVHLLVLLPGV